MSGLCLGGLSRANTPPFTKAHCGPQATRGQLHTRMQPCPQASHPTFLEVSWPPWALGQPKHCRSLLSPQGVLLVHQKPKGLLGSSGMTPSSPSPVAASSPERGTRGGHISLVSGAASQALNQHPHPEDRSRVKSTRRSQRGCGEPTQDGTSQSGQGGFLLHLQTPCKHPCMAGPGRCHNCP